MAIETKSIQESQAKWGLVTPGRAAEYSARAQAAGQKWESGAIGAVPIMLQALSAANMAARVAQGLRRAGAGKFSRKIRTVGEMRFGPGIAAAVADYGERFAPFLQIIQGVTLPGRGPRGDPRNYQRSTAVGDALYRARIASSAAGA